MKSFISKKELDGLVEQVSSVVSKSDVKELKRIGEKYNLVLNRDRITNLNLWWREIVKLLENLPTDNKFRKLLIEDKKYFPGNFDQSVIREFIAYSKIEDEYLFLSDKKWKDLDSLLFNLGTSDEYRIAQIGVKTFIDMGGDIREHFKKFSKEQADPEALKLTKELKKSIDTLLSGLSIERQLNAANAILSYVSEGLKLDEDDFHNTVFRGE